MPMLYDHIPISHSGMISSHPFDLPGDGRKVFFDIAPGGAFRKEIYILQDGKFNESAFANGSRLETAVRGLERWFALPHEAYVIVVDRSEQTLPDMPVAVAPIPVTFPDGTNATICLSGSMQASIVPEDPAWLAREYVSGSITCPETTAATTMQAVLKDTLVRVIAAAAQKVSPQSFVGKVDELSLELAQSVRNETEHRLPWCRVAFCDVSISVTNLSELLTISNKAVTFTDELMRAAIEAIKGTFGASPLPAEVSQLIQTYMQTNPGLPPEKITVFCKELHGLYQRSDPAVFINVAQQFCALPAGKGGSQT